MVLDADFAQAEIGVEHVSDTQYLLEPGDEVVVWMHEGNLVKLLLPKGGEILKRGSPDVKKTPGNHFKNPTGERR